MEQELSIIIPLYNEQDNLSELYQKLIKVLDSLNLSYEIIFVDDGSTDNSFNILKELYQRDPKVKVISFRKNFGKSAALAAGFDNTRGKIIITMDADLQDEPSEIPKLVEKIKEGYDLVSGWKYPRRDPLSKIIPSKIFNIFVSLFSGIKLHDLNCGFKAYRAQVIKEIDIYGELHRFLPVIAFQKGFKVTEIKVAHNPRKYGKSKFGPVRFIHGVLDFLTVMLLTKYTERPAHFFGGWGILSFILGFGICLYLTILWFLGQRPIGNRPLLFLGILLIIISIQLISLGLLGEIFVSRDSKKRYEVKEVLK
jgi:glycosyltransferase involved in cell wall biosynthesis